MPKGISPAAAQQAFDTATERNREITNAVAREWRAFVEANLTLERQRQDATDALDAFERGDAVLHAREQAEETLRAIERAWQQVFQEYFQSYRQQVQERLHAERETQRAHNRLPAPQPTPQEITLTTWEELRERALGLIELPDAPGSGYGEVPLPDGQIGYVDVSALADVPGASTTWRTQHMSQSRLLMLAGLGVVFVIVLVWFVTAALSGPGSTADTTQTAEVLANERALPAWDPTELDVTLRDGSTRTLPVVMGIPTDLADDTAYWSTSVVFPATACVPPHLLPDTTMVWVRGGNRIPDRAYALVADSGGIGAPTPPADLHLRGCGRDTPARHAILHVVTPPAAHAPGESARVPLPNGEETTVTVESISIVGPATRPDLPAGRARVTVIVQPEQQPLNWNALTPELVLETGEAASRVPLVEQADGTVIFAYLVTLPQRPLPVEWRVTGGDEQQRWRTVLEPPLTRAEALYRSVQVTEGDAESPAPGTLRLTLEIEHGGETPLAIEPSDIQVAQGETPLEFTFDRDTREENVTPLEPGETRVVVLNVATRGTRQPVTVTLGASRYVVE